LVEAIAYLYRMEEMIHFILQFGDFNEQQMAIIRSSVQERTIRKGAYFSEATKVPREVGFVVEGVMRGYYYDHKGKEITRCFIAESNLVADYVNFEANVASLEYLQACTDCRLMIFPKKNWEDLSGKIPGWDHAKNKMVQQCMYLKSRKYPVASQDATTRYLEFLDNYPTLANRVALSYIASYLGVTQQSLSRIRKNVR